MNRPSRLAPIPCRHSLWHVAGWPMLNKYLKLVFNSIISLLLTSRSSNKERKASRQFFVFCVFSSFFFCDCVERWLFIHYTHNDDDWVTSMNSAKYCVYIRSYAEMWNSIKISQKSYVTRTTDMIRRWWWGDLIYIPSINMWVESGWESESKYKDERRPRSPQNDFLTRTSYGARQMKASIRERKESSYCL